MSKKANPIVIGSFVLAAIVIAAAGILVLGSGKFFNESMQYVLYFDGNLSGLNVGAPVEFGGVRIGQVADISLIYDHKDASISIPVTIDINKDSFSEINLDSALTIGTGMKIHVAKGMRAQLKSQSMVTGKLKIQLGYHENAPIVLRAKNDQLEEIPTVPGSMDSLTRRLAKLPLDEIIIDFREGAKVFAEIAKSGKLQASLDELQKTLKSVSEMASSKELKEGLVSLNATLLEGQKMMMAMNKGAEPARKEVMIVLEKLGDAARALQYFADYLERHPESLIRGKGKE